MSSNIAQDQSLSQDLNELPRALRFASDAEILDERYIDPMPIQGEHEPVSISQRRDAILATPVNSGTGGPYLLCRSGRDGPVEGISPFLHSNTAETMIDDSPFGDLFFGDGPMSSLTELSGGESAKSGESDEDDSDDDNSESGEDGYERPYSPETRDDSEEGTPSDSGEKSSSDDENGYEKAYSKRKREDMSDLSVGSVPIRGTALPDLFPSFDDNGKGKKTGKSPGDSMDDINPLSRSCFSEELDLSLSGSSHGESGSNEERSSSLGKRRGKSDWKSRDKKKLGSLSHLIMSPFAVIQQKKSKSLAASREKEEFDWNKKFQMAVSQVCQLHINSHPEEQYEAFRTLNNLAVDFTHTVRTYARIIASEASLPDEQKSIKPQPRTINIGYDSVQYYIVNNIKFYLAPDVTQMGPMGFVNQAQVANLELKSANKILECWEPGIYVPLTVIVDYCGIRVVGQTIPPVDEKTFVHGTRDRGKTFSFSQVFSDKTHVLGAQLNLQPHTVLSVSSKEATEALTFWLPADMEGHVGQDKLNYLTNLWRLMPMEGTVPETSDKEAPPEGDEKESDKTDGETSDGSAGRIKEPTASAQKPAFIVTHRRLRPEFVSVYDSPLCSDANTSFLSEKVQEETTEINEEVDRATQYLVEHVIPDFSKRLVAIPAAERDKQNLILLLHRAGINVRFLGLLHNLVKELKDEYWCLRILVNMCARVIKRELRLVLWEQMRYLQLPGESVYRSIIVSYLNDVLGSSPSAQRHWSQYIVPALQKKFRPFVHKGKHQLLHVLASSSRRVGLRDGRLLILELVCQSMGLEFAGTTWQELTRSPRTFMRYQPFTDTDLKPLGARVKEMGIVTYSGAVVLAEKAKRATSEEERTRLIKLALREFEQSLVASPNNSTALRRIGECYTALGQFEEAQNAFLLAMQVAPEDTVTFFKYAVALDKHGSLDEAEEYFLRSLEQCPSYCSCCYFYADFLCHHHKNYEYAEKFYKRALEIDPKNRSAANNYAVFLTTVKKNYPAAEELFKRAVEKSTKPVYLENYASFLFYIRRNKEEAEIYRNKAKKLESKNTL